MKSRVQKLCLIGNGQGLPSAGMGHTVCCLLQGKAKSPPRRQLAVSHPPAAKVEADKVQKVGAMYMC